MRTALLFVALFGMAALAMAADTTTATYTLTGKFYPDTACTGTGYDITSAYNTGSTTTTFPCVTAGTGSGAWALEAYCTNWSLLGVNVQYWYISATLGATCPTAGGAPTGGTTWIYGSGTDFTTKGTLTSFSSGTSGCFQPSGCSSASTLVVPSVLLVALAYVASKLSL